MTRSPLPANLSEVAIRRWAVILTVAGLVYLLVIPIVSLAFWNWRPLVYGFVALVMLCVCAVTHAFGRALRSMWKR